MIIARTPLRLSFVGGGSDIADFYTRSPGKVVCTAIDKFVYAIVKERFDDLIYINYSRKECVESVSEIRHDLVREAMKITGVEKGIEITTLADIPSTGSGLGSSSSITVALLHALYAYQNVLVTAEQLAQEACRIEIEILKKPIGKQDQYAAAFGGVNRFIFHPDGRTERIPIVMSSQAKRKFSASLLLYFTGLTRSADGILTRQKDNYRHSDVFSRLQKMVDLVDPFSQAMVEADIELCGKLLADNWRLKQELTHGISTPEIDAMYEKAIQAGALAGKIAGAGGGGFLMLIVPREHQNQVFETMKEYRELPFMMENSGSKIIFDHRSYPSK